MGLDEPRESFRILSDRWVRRHPWIFGLILSTLAFGITLLIDGIILHRDDPLDHAAWRAVSFFVIGVLMAKIGATQKARKTRESIG